MGLCELGVWLCELGWGYVSWGEAMRVGVGLCELGWGYVSWGGVM